MNRMLFRGSTLTLLCVIGLFAMVAVRAQAANKTNANEPALTAADRAFLNDALKSGNTEIDTSKMAQQKSQDASVKNLAATIQRDHEKFNARIKTLTGNDNTDMAGSNYGTSSDMPLDKGQDPHMNQLQGMTGNSFNQHYADMQVSMHDEAIAKFEKVVNGSGYSARVKQLAREGLVDLRKHRASALAVKNSTTPAASR